MSHSHVNGFVHMPWTQVSLTPFTVTSHTGTVHLLSKVVNLEFWTKRRKKKPGLIGLRSWKMRELTRKLRPTIPVSIARDLDCRSSRFHWPVKNQNKNHSFFRTSNDWHFWIHIRSTYLKIFGYACKIVVILEGSEDGVSFGTEIGDGESRQKCDPMSHDWQKERPLSGNSNCRAL